MEHIKLSKFAKLFPNTCIVGEKKPSFTPPLPHFIHQPDEYNSSSEEQELKQELEEMEPALFCPTPFEFQRLIDVLEEKTPPVAVYLSPQIMETVSTNEKSSVMLNFLLQRTAIEDLQVFLHGATIKTIPDFAWMYCPRVFYEDHTPVDFANASPKLVVARLLHFFSYDEHWTPELSYRLSKAVYSILNQRDIQNEDQYTQDMFEKKLLATFPLPLEFFFEKEQEELLRKTFVSLWQASMLYAKEKKAFILRRTSKRLTFKEAFAVKADNSYFEALKTAELTERAFERYKEEMNTSVV